MSHRKETTHILIARKLTLYLRPRSTVWQCKYKIEGRWRRATTNERELESAKKRAYDILIEAKVRIKLNVVPFTRKFKDVATQAIVRIDKELQDDYGKVIYKEYKIAINKYMIPFLGNYNVDSIDPVTNQKRVLYSLRHTYATIALTYDHVEVHTLAKQMGTSIAMIEKHYSHLDVVKAMDQLQGVESRLLIEAVGAIDQSKANTANTQET